jgi:hypothetical protein
MNDERIAMNEKQQKRWERMKGKGRLRFVLIYGVLLFGLPQMILWTLIDYFREPQKLTLSRLMVWSSVCLLMGFVSGLTSWELFDRNYRKIR